ncbi:YcxB family protein [Desulfovibrio litoralis]|uniref:YcxB-like protein n=1 Tax=Desulfovibrio litoralis DSM 11393 TaxID=1121455 RepID=A0A1M7S0R4_9BACT|nr:YcxB family protein [Desulfovibrio litoralis]SHN52048.1 YcxB-like protein [Desulfovibrio litoralis DSM 11393]
MTIHYKVSEQDYINFNIDHYNNMKSQKNKRFVYGVILLMFFFLFLPFLNDNSLSLVEIISSVFFLIAWFIFFPKIINVFIRKSVREYIKNGKANDFIGNQTILLADDYIETLNATTQSRIQYAAVERICTGNQLFYIYVGSVKALIIPFSAFENEEIKNSFFEIIHQKTGLNVLAK